MTTFTPQIAVIGLGAFGMALVKSLGRQGANVIAVDNNLDHIEDVKQIATDAICFDATDTDQLENHGITEVDIAVVAIGEAFEPVVIISMALLNAGVKEVYARATSKTQEQILERIGVTEVIHPERQVGERMGISLQRKGLKDLLELGEGLSILEIQVPEKMIGYRISELKLRERYGINILTVHRPEQETKNEEPVNYKTLGIPDPSMKLKKGDKIVVLGSKAECDKLLDLN